MVHLQPSSNEDFRSAFPSRQFENHKMGHRSRLHFEPRVFKDCLTSIKRGAKTTTTGTEPGLVTAVRAVLLTNEP